MHMADAISRVTSGRKIGAFCMQHGPGSENAYGGVAQSYSESVPLLVIPQGYPRRIAGIDPNFSASREMRGVAKIAEHVIVPGEITNVMRRAFNNLRNGRSGPAIVEIPTDIWSEEIGDLDYTPVSHVRYAPDPADVRKAAAAILAAKRPVIYAGTGVQWAEAWPQLRTFAELLGAPVTTSLGGKSSFPENHPLSLGSGGNAVPQTVHHFVTNADLIIGIGCSFTETNFGIKFPKGKKFIHATLDPNHLNKDVPAAVGLVGDAALTLDALIGELKQSIKSNRDTGEVVREITAVRAEWMAQWKPLLEFQRGADQPVSRDLGTDAGHRPEEHDHHPRRRQPARSDIAVLGLHRADVVYRLGQDHTAWHGAGPGDGGEAGKAGQALHQLLGRCGDRLHRHGFRDGGARAHPHPVLPDEQLLHGDRTEGDAGIDREVPVHRHLRQLRRHGEGVRRLWRARD